MTRLGWAIPLILLAAACSGPKGQGPVKEYQLSGVVVRLEPRTQVATIKHGPIHAASGELWMEAMTMDFPVRDKAEFAKLKKGQKVRATVHQRQDDYEYWISGIVVDQEMGETSQVMGHPPQGPAIVD
ncbi:MAG: copper-binding protein [Bryobacterales bacterium]|nr:copper-binding protein [Bryobacterales bacterium]